MAGDAQAIVRVPSCHSAFFGGVSGACQSHYFVGEIQPLRPFGECMSPGAAHPDAFSEGE